MTPLTPKPTPGRGPSAVALLATLVGGTLVASPASAFNSTDAIDSITVRDDAGGGGFFTVDFENNYLPNVVLRENGAASFEALKAQAVAARTFAYYKIETGSTFIRNGQSDQVYSLGGQKNNPGGLWEQAVRETEGEFLSFNGITTAAFYVAGARPSNPNGIATASDPDPTNTERFVTYTRANNLVGPFNQGSSLGFRGTTTNPNYPNRGAMSQNGADVLSDQNIHYLDILKFYYGGDIQLGLVDQSPTQTPFGVKTLASFDRNDETFARALTFSGQSRNLGSGTSVQQTTAVARTGAGSQQLTIDYDVVGDLSDGTADGFFIRHLSSSLNTQRLTNLTSGNRINPVADPTGNLILPTTGTLGFSLRVEPTTINPLLEVAIAIDDFNDNALLSNTTEQSTFYNVLADGQWHTYEWQLDDATFSSAFGAAGDGVLGQRFTLDSILLRGFGDATVYLDDVFFDVTGVLPVPEPSSILLLTATALLTGRRRRSA